MVHWRSVGGDFKTHLLEVLVLDSGRDRPTTFSSKSGLLNNSGLPSPSHWQRLESRAVCSVFRSWTAFKASFCVPTVGCAKTQESICLKSSIGQLLMWTSGLLFSEEKTADYSLSSCMQHTQGWNSFQARRGQCGIVQLYWKCYAVQWTPLVYPILFKWKYSQIHWHTKQFFSKSQHLNTA